MSGWSSSRVTLGVLATAVAALSVVACSDAAPATCAERCGPGRLEVALVAPETQLWLDDGATVAARDCAGDDRADPAACGDAVAFLPGAGGSLVAKAPGYRTRTEVVSLPAPSGCEACAPAGGGPISVALEALAEPVVTADYRTGFGADLDAGLAAFQALAYHADDELGPVYAVKFFVEHLDGAPTVYFQDTKKHPIHYDFVHGVLGRAVSQRDFEEATYRATDRTQMAGTLVYRPELATTSATAGGAVTAPVTIEFFPSDTLSSAQAEAAYLALEEAMPFLPRRGTSHRLYYLPPGARQEADAAAARRAFDAAGVRSVLRSELFAGVDLQLLNPGVAYGTLRVLTPEELDEAAVSFRDVLVLPRLPNELPIVGGTLTGELQTPLAHVNVAAHARHTPNLARPGVESDPAVLALAGKLVRFEVKAGAWTLAETTLAEAQAYWASRQQQNQLIPTADLSDLGFVDFDAMGFADSPRFGVKAANIAELHHILGDRAPDGFGIPFHDYDRFVSTARLSTALCGKAGEDCLAEGRSAATCAAAEALCDRDVGLTLDDHARAMLADPGFQTDSQLRFAALDMHRYLYCHVTNGLAWLTALEAKVRARLGTIPIRMRSSTNAEDLPGFSGAGLYSSFGAQLDTAEPPKTRVCKTWASVWNWQAFEERAFWNIDHLAVRMGVAVHEAFPDEAANGVLITQNIGDPLTRGMYVNVQLGEVSVTNPEGGAVPEIFAITPGPSGVQVARQRFSSLSPDAPILTDAEVGALASAAYAVQQRFATLYDEAPDLLALDIEFKFHGPTRALILKQVRPYRQD